MVVAGFGVQVPSPGAGGSGAGHASAPYPGSVPLHVAIIAFARSSLNGIYSPDGCPYKAGEAAFPLVSRKLHHLEQSGSSIHLALTPDPALAAAMLVTSAKEEGP